MFTLHNGDGIQFMRSLQSKSIGAIITDPPYGLDFQGESWDSFIPEWIAEARRVAKIVAFTTAPTTQWDYPRPEWVNNWYRAGSTSRTSAGGFNHWSPVLVYGKVKFMVDTYVTAAALTGMQNKGIEHPSPKDLGLYRWLIDNTSSEGETILDPFMGSGTTGVAALQLKRVFIGCELKAEYFAIAEKRIKSAALSPALFTPSNNRLHADVGDSPAQQALFTPEADTAEGKSPTPAPRR